MQKNIEENNEKDLVSYSLFYIFLFLMALINLPIFITAFICYFLLFRLLKQKPLINGLISGLLLLAGSCNSNLNIQSILLIYISK